MTVDHDALRAGLEAAIPFNTHLGLRTVEVGEGIGVVVLPDAAHLHNHVGSQHAGALFSAAEAASGAAFVGAFAERLGDIVPLARSAEIDYRKLARGEITATGRLAEPAADLLATLDAEGVVRFAVQVELVDGDRATVAAVTVHWHVRAKE